MLRGGREAASFHTVCLIYEIQGRRAHTGVNDHLTDSRIALAGPYNILYDSSDERTPQTRGVPGSAQDDLRAFPAAARREAGHQIDQVQQGRDPDDWKLMNTVGQGVREIRIREEDGAFRVIYVAKLEDAIYVLHCFQKKTRNTRKADLDLAAKRYRDLVKELDR
jgi:phage-related protein